MGTTKDKTMLRAPRGCISLAFKHSPDFPARPLALPAVTAWRCSARKVGGGSSSRLMRSLSSEKLPRGASTAHSASSARYPAAGKLKRACGWAKEETTKQDDWRRRCTGLACSQSRLPGFHNQRNCPALRYPL